MIDSVRVLLVEDNIGDADLVQRVPVSTRIKPVSMC